MPASTGTHCSRCSSQPRVMVSVAERSWWRWRVAVRRDRLAPAIRSDRLPWWLLEGRTGVRGRAVEAGRRSAGGLGGGCDGWRRGDGAAPVGGESIDPGLRSAWNPIRCGFGGRPTPAPAAARSASAMSTVAPPPARCCATGRHRPGAAGRRAGRPGRRGFRVRGRRAGVGVPLLPGPGPGVETPAPSRRCTVRRDPGARPA